MQGDFTLIHLSTLIAVIASGLLLVAKLSGLVDQQMNKIAKQFEQSTRFNDILISINDDEIFHFIEGVSDKTKLSRTAKITAHKLIDCLEQIYLYDRYSVTNWFGIRISAEEATIIYSWDDYIARLIGDHKLLKDFLGDSNEAFYHSEKFVHKFK